MRTVLVLFAFTLASQAATMTQAYTFSTIGISSSPTGSGCTTYGPTSVMRASTLNLGIAQAIPGCGPAEDLKNNLGTGNLVTASSAVSGGGVGTNGAFTGSGSAFAKAASNQLGVDAEFSLIGVPDPNTVRGSEALAMFSETLSNTTASITNGKLRYTLGLTGSQTFASSVAGANPGGDAFFYLAYRNLAQSFFYPIFFASTGTAGTYTQVFGTYQYTTGNGITIAPNSISVNRNFILEVPFNNTSPFDAAFYMYAGAYASSNSDIDFVYSNTLNILSVEAFDNSGNQVDLIRSSAETAVPEPNTTALLSLLAVASLTTIRGRAVTGHTPARPNPLRRLFRLG